MVNKYISLSLSIYIYIYVCVCVCVYIYIYIKPGHKNKLNIFLYLQKINIFIFCKRQIYFMQGTIIQQFEVQMICLNSLWHFSSKFRQNTFHWLPIKIAKPFCDQGLSLMRSSFFSVKRVWSGWLFCKKTIVKTRSYSQGKHPRNPPQPVPKPRADVDTARQHANRTGSYFSFPGFHDHNEKTFN